MGVKRVAVIEGEDASPEAVRPTVELIDRMKLGVEWIYPPVGERGEASHGSIFPVEAREMIDNADTTLFGATSGKSALALFHLRWGKETYASVRPAKWRPGYRSALANPEGIKLVIVRENLEDLYLMAEGDLEALAPARVFSLILQKPVAELRPESAHGCAPDIAGRNIINPTATLLSAVMMLDYLGFGSEAMAIDKTLSRVYAEGRCLTPDQGGTASTVEFLHAVEARL